MVKWDIQHTLIMVAVTLLSATAGYLEQQSATTILDALQSWAAAKHMVYMSIVFDLTALVTLAKQSFVVPPNNGGNGSATKLEQKAQPSSFPKKPAAMRVRQWATACMLGLAACAITVTTGCSGLNIVSIVTQLSTYVTAFIQVAQTIWATILPLLGSNAASANVAFNDAIVSLQNANALMMDGEQAYEAGKTVNLPQLMAAVQDAVQRVMAVINQFKGSMPANGYAIVDKTETLERMAISIRHWQEAR